jgi:hypothetical protein
MCMFDENGIMLPEEFDEEGNLVGPTCDGCGDCYDNDNDYDDDYDDDYRDKQEFTPGQIAKRAKENSKMYFEALAKKKQRYCPVGERYGRSIDRPYRTP